MNGLWKSGSEMITDGEPAALNHRRARTHALKQGVMQGLLTGKTMPVPSDTRVIL